MLTWHSLKNTSDFISGCGQFVAMYICTERGFGRYEVYRVGCLRKSTRNAISVGGLPTSYHTLRAA